MSVILCRKEKVSHPFFIENLGIHIYTSQELCYAIYNHPLLALDGFMDRNLVDFIREELDMGYTALKLERWMKGGENQDELLFLFLQECDYYTTAEINRLRQKVAALRKLPPLEYAKRKADYLFGFKQYGRAVAGYEKILESTDEMKAAWDEDFAKAKKEADQSDGIKKLEEMFSRDPIRRMEGARQTLEAWKQEYRGTA